MSARIPGWISSLLGGRTKAPKQWVVIVSGLPRSGTSMMMSMLAAGGLEIIEDGRRTPDEDNPRGYFEDERVKLLARGDAQWLQDCLGKAIKIVSPLLQYLPPGLPCRVVFMERSLVQVLASQRNMLANSSPGSETNDARLAEAFERHLRDVRNQLHTRENTKVLPVNYTVTVEKPLKTAIRVNRFLGAGLAVRRMAEAVDPRLYRNRDSGVTRIGPHAAQQTTNSLLR